MIRAAICDDEPVILEQLRGRIFDEFKRQGAVIRLDTFTSGQEFLEAHANEPFDVVFLDIDMPEISGFDVAGRISRAEHTLIVFVTMHDELVYSSFQFQPFRFIRKAYLESELPGIMEAVVNEVTKQNSEKKYAFQTRFGKTFVNLGSVEYIEIYGHWLRVCIKDGEPLECYGSLSDLEKELGDHDFVRTHKSFLVNCKFIFSIERNQVILDDKTAIPLSRYKSEAVRRKFKNILRRTL